MAARCARHVGDVAGIHRGTGGYRSANAARPARRSPTPRDGSAATDGAVIHEHQAAPSASSIEHRGATRRPVRGSGEGIGNRYDWSCLSSAAHSEKNVRTAATSTAPRLRSTSV